MRHHSSAARQLSRSSRTQARRLREVFRGLQKRRSVTARDERELSARDETFARVLAERLEHAIARDVAADIGDDERLIDERREHVEHAHVRGVLVAVDERDARGSIDRASSGEYGKRCEQFPFVIVEQIVAPIDRRPHRLLTRLCQTRATAKRRQMAAQVDRERRQRKRGNACGGEFDRERNALHERADLGDDGRAGVVERERSIERRRPFGEQSDRRERRRLRRREPVACFERRTRQRGKPVHAFARDAQRLATRRENLQLRARSK